MARSMRLEVGFDSSSWLELPKSFPTAEGLSAQQWEDRILAGMREAWKGSLTPQAEPVVRQAIRHGLSRVDADDSVTLQYWPGASIINAVVHFVGGSIPEGEQKRVVPLDGGPFVVEPQNALIESENLGTGVESAALVSFDEEPPVVLGILNYLFENDESFVFVGIEPTMPELVGMMQEPLREIVRGIRVVTDDGGSWQKSEVGPSMIETGHETWNFERAGVTR